MEVKKNAIVVIFGDDYWNYARACLNSIIHNYPDHPGVVVLFHGKSNRIVDWLNSLPGVRVVLYAIDKEKHFSGNYEYIKYELWTDRFSEYDTLLYLDIDTLVLKPLDHLFKKDEFFIVCNHGQYKAEMIFDLKQKRNPGLKKKLKDDGLADVWGLCHMANTGMFLIPAQYRTSEYYRQLKSLTKRYNEFLQYGDQSAISLWCLQNEISVSHELRYNFRPPMIGNKKVRGYLHSAYIIHFAHFKPDQSGFMDDIYSFGAGEYLQELYESYLV